LTPTDARMRKPVEMHAELVLIEVPVYGRRLSVDAISRLRRFDESEGIRKEDP